MTNGSEQLGEQRPVAGGDPLSAPEDRRGRAAIVALGVLSAFFLIAALASALGVDLPFGDDDRPKNRSPAALPPEWRNIDPLRPLLPQGEGSGVASANRKGGRSRDRAEAEGGDAASLTRAPGDVQTPVRRVRPVRRSVPVAAASSTPRRPRAVRLSPLDRLLDLDARVRLPGLTGSIDLDLPDLSGFPVGRGGVDIDIDVGGPDIDIDVDIPDIGSPDLPRPPGLPGLPGLPGRPNLPDLPGLPDVGRPTRSLPSAGSPLPTGAVPVRLSRTRDSSPARAQLLGRVTGTDRPGSDGARERSPGSRSREPERRPSEEAARSGDRGEEAARVSARRSLRAALKASKELLTTVAGVSEAGPGRGAADCRRAPENRNDRDCARRDRDRDRRQERRDEDDDRGREEDDRSRGEDDRGAEPDGA